MLDDYLIPANTKRGRLILSFFRPFDLFLFGTGICITLFLLTIIPLDSLAITILVLAPAAITGFLVMPVPYYHNMLIVIAELYQFLTNRQTYRWKGWCYKNVTKRKK